MSLVPKRQVVHSARFPKIAGLFALTACTTLGPMPATTGISAVPNNRPSADGQLGAVPAFYLSQSAKNEAKGAPITQAQVLLEPDRWIHAPGIVIAARVFGQSGDTPLEPYVGYRRKLGDRLALGGGLYGTAKRSTDRLASYHATRVGGEAAADATLWSVEHRFALHGQASAALTRILASGTYCVDPMGIAIDCNIDDPTKNTMLSGKQTGVYPAGTATVAFDFLREAGRRFRGLRVAIPASIGTMPLVQNGDKTGSGMYWGLGLTITLSLGLADMPGDPLPANDD